MTLLDAEILLQLIVASSFLWMANLVAIMVVGWSYKGKAWYF